MWNVKVVLDYLKTFEALRLVLLKDLTLNLCCCILPLEESHALIPIQHHTCTSHVTPSFQPYDKLESQSNFNLQEISTDVQLTETCFRLGFNKYIASKTCDMWNEKLC